jgi:hypothetical protein
MGAMRRIVATMATASVLTTGVGAVAVVTVAPHHTATRAVTCAQPFDPTVRYVVNKVCSIFGP